MYSRDSSRDTFPFENLPVTNKEMLSIVDLLLICDFRSMYDRHKGGPPRLPGYDYTSCGYYFVTINVKDMIPYFGQIIDKRNYVNALGMIVEDNWLYIPSHFNGVSLDTFVVMPEHIHGIVRITEREPEYSPIRILNRGGITGTNSVMCGRRLGTIVRWFKARCTRLIREDLPEFRWLPRYYDVVIRSHSQ